MKTVLLAFEILFGLLSWGFLSYIQTRVTEEIVDWDLDRKLSRSIKYLRALYPLEIVLRLVQQFLNSMPTPLFYHMEILLFVCVYLIQVIVFKRALTIFNILNRLKYGPPEELASEDDPDEELTPEPETPWYVNN